MFRPTCGGCFGLRLLRPFLLLWLPLAASAFLGCIRPMERKLQRLSETWKMDFPWLDVKQGPFRLGCRICHEAGVRGMFSVTSPAQMQRIAFQRHQQRPQHREAASCQPVVCAPAADVFEKIVSDIQNGTPTCSSRKESQLTWCLAEALKTMDQVVLAKCAAISLFRDERDGRIAIRFRAVTPDLHVLSGFLGQEQFSGTGGRALTIATEHVMKRACSRFSGRHDSKQKSFLKKSLFRHFKSKLPSGSKVAPRTTSPTGDNFDLKRCRQHRKGVASIATFADASKQPCMAKKCERYEDRKHSKRIVYILHAWTCSLSLRHATTATVCRRT